MKKRTMILIALTAGTSACAVGAVVYAQSVKVRMEERLLEATNQLALQDTARLLDSATIALLGDSITGYQRLVEQVTIDKDQLDERLRLRPVVRVNAGIRVDTIRFTDTVTVSGERADSIFAIDSENDPFRITGAFTYSPPNGFFDAEVTMTRPLNVGVRIGCEEGPGINSATVVLTAEDPFSLVPEKPLQQDPWVCNERPQSFLRSLIPDITPKGLLVEVLKGAIYFGIGKIIEEKLFDDKDDSPSNCYDCVVY